MSRIGAGIKTPPSRGKLKYSTQVTLLKHEKGLSINKEGFADFKDLDALAEGFINLFSYRRSKDKLVGELERLRNQIYKEIPPMGGVLVGLVYVQYPPMPSLKILSHAHIIGSGSKRSSVLSEYECRKKHPGVIEQAVAPQYWGSEPIHFWGRQSSRERPGKWDVIVDYIWFSWP